MYRSISKKQKRRAAAFFSIDAARTFEDNKDSFSNRLSRLQLGFEIPLPIPLTGQKEDPYRLMWMLGLALTLPMILLSGPLAGYLIGWALVKRGSPGFVSPLLMALGLFGSGLQSYALIKKLYQNRKS